jgi:asparagine synthase (glutamine-hydrolysing)
MFAFALYRLKERRLLLARDRVGIKPLYWAGMPAGIVFGSEPKALLASGFVRQRINLVGIHDYLAVGYATPPATCWADIHVLEPGSWLEIDRRGERHGRYWNWSPRPNFEGDIGPLCARGFSQVPSGVRRSDWHVSVGGVGFLFDHRPAERMQSRAYQHI